MASSGPYPSLPSPISTFSPVMQDAYASSPLPSQSFSSSTSSATATAAQAQILQLQAQIIQLQAQLLLQPSSSGSASGLTLPSPSRHRSLSAISNSLPQVASPRPKLNFNPSPNSLSLPHPISPAQAPLQRNHQTLPRSSITPRTLSPQSLPRTLRILDDESRFARNRACSTGELVPVKSPVNDQSQRAGQDHSQHRSKPFSGLLSEAELVLEASPRSYDQRVRDLDQYRAQLRAEAALMPHSPSKDSILPSPPLPSMSDLAAKVINVLNASESRSVLSTSTSQSTLRGHHEMYSFDDARSLFGLSDDERSVSSNERSPNRMREDIQPMQSSTLKGGNLMKKRGLRGWSQRYVLLNPVALSYYKGSVLKASLPLTGDCEVRPGPVGAEFVVSDGAKKETIIQFAAASETERREWMTAIQDVIEADRKSERYVTRNGELNLRFWFEEEKFTLHVEVIGARGLKRKNKKLTYNNAYAKLKILPKQGKAYRTRVIKNCVDPTWNESFHFRLERSTLTVQALHVKVKNDEAGLDMLFGEIDLPLLNVSFDEQDPTSAWFPIQTLNEKKDDASFVSTPRERAASTTRQRSLSNGSLMPPSPAPLGDITSLSFVDFEPKRTPETQSRRLSQELLPLPLTDEEIVPVGTIRASVWYDTESEMLQVEVVECRLHKAKLHFVELKILPSESEVQPFKTKVQKDVFNEKFAMALGSAKVTFSTLSFAVKDRRTTFGKSKDIGEFVLPLDRIPRTTAGATQTHWLTAPSSTIFELHNLGDILLLEAGYQSFLLTVEKEHSTENLLFWKDVQDFRYKYLDASEDQRANCMSECLEMCHKYIDVDAESEINVPPSIKEKIRAQISDEKQMYSNWCEPLACIFDHAQSDVLDLMSRDPFARYLASQEWANFSKYLLQESTERELGFKVVNMIVDFGYVNRAREAMYAGGRSTMARGRDRFRRLPDALQRDIITPPRQLRPRQTTTRTFT